MEGHDGMRAADSDRQAVAERLRVALDEGRLDLHEYDERLQRTYAARTYAELNVLVGDLPLVGAMAPTAGSAPAQRDGDASVPTLPDGGRPTTALPDGRRSITARWLAEVWEPWLKTVGIVFAVWAVMSVLTGDAMYFWPGWVAGPWGAVLLVRTVTGLSTGEPGRWAIEQQRKSEKKAEKRALKRERKALRQQQLADEAASTDGQAGGGVGPKRDGRA